MTIHSDVRIIVYVVSVDYTAIVVVPTEMNALVSGHVTYLPMRVTPLSDGILPTERESAVALQLNRVYQSLCQQRPDHALDLLAEQEGIELQWLEKQPTPYGCFINEGTPRIWLPRSTRFEECCSFAHELHHFKFAPPVVACRDLTRTQVAKWEGRATAFSALFVMPLCEYTEAEQIMRAFGPFFSHAAHYRIQHLERRGW